MTHHKKAHEEAEEEAKPADQVEVQDPKGVSQYTMSSTVQAMVDDQLYVKIKHHG